MDQGTQVTEKPRQDLDLEARDIEILAYIQSNKFITTKVFHKKFHPNHSHSMACVHLRDLAGRGLIVKTQKMPCEDSFYYLTRPALHQLLSLGRILTSPEVRSPHINPYEREHDKRVLEMRVRFESDPALTNLTWLSDYEMRCGVRMDWKKVLEQGRGNELEKVKLHRFHKRTPDGYFEATIGGQAYGFVLEYEHTPYNRVKMTAMVLNLNRDFPGAFKLIVSQDPEHAIRMAGGLEGYLKSNPREKPVWAFSYFDKVTSVPFTQVPWATLERKYLPFVKDPILKQAPVEAQPTEVHP